MALPNVLINGHAYNWYEVVAKIDALSLEGGLLAISGISEEIEKEPQYGTGREPIDIAQGKIVHAPITITMYAFLWQRVKAYLTTKSLGRGYGLVSFSFSVIATGNILEGAPPIGDVWSGAEIAKVGKEYSPDVNGSRVDVTIQPLRHRDIDGMTLVNI